jgi:FkbM family methyltransferase
MRFAKCKKILKFLLRPRKIGPLRLVRNTILDSSLHFFVHSSDCIIGRWISGDIETPLPDLCEYRLLLELASESHIILDIGANIGLTACLMSRRSPDSIIIAFEPGERSFALAALNKEYNDCKNVRLFKFAIADRSGLGNLLLNARNHGDMRLLKDSNGTANSAVNSTEVVSLLGSQEVCELIFSQTENRMVDLVKIDTQGWDFVILNAIKPVLGKVARIILEYSPFHMSFVGHTLDSVLQSLSSFSKIQVLQPDFSTYNLNISNCDEEFLRSFWAEKSVVWKGHVNLLLTV